MSCAIAVNIGEDKEQTILHMSQVSQIVSSKANGVRVVRKEKVSCVEMDGHTFSIIDANAEPHNWPFFLILASEEALGIKDFRLLFGVKVLSNGCLTGKDIDGKGYTGKPFDVSTLNKNHVGCKGEMCELKKAQSPLKQLDSIEEVLNKLRQGEFYAALTEELSEKIKRIADEMIAFRKDLQKKIEPNIVGLVTNEIPETSNELEGVNETLEKSTMKIMDIADEILALCASRLQEFNCLISETCVEQEEGSVEEGEETNKWDLMERQFSLNTDITREMIEKHIKSFEKIRKLSMNMTEPLCFQDLVGQRIQRIVKLVKSMEDRVQDLVVTLGVKLQKHRENPDMTFEQVNKEVGKDHSLLKGPQKEGEGLNQSAVDELLASL